VGRPAKYLPECGREAIEFVGPSGRGGHEIAGPPRARCGTGCKPTATMRARRRAILTGVVGQPALRPCDGVGQEIQTR